MADDAEMQEIRQQLTNLQRQVTELVTQINRWRQAGLVVGDTGRLIGSTANNFAAGNHTHP